MKISYRLVAIEQGSPVPSARSEPCLGSGAYFQLRLYGVCKELLFAVLVFAGSVIGDRFCFAVLGLQAVFIGQPLALSREVIL